MSLSLVEWEKGREEEQVRRGVGCQWGKQLGEIIYCQDYWSETK